MGAYLDAPSDLDGNRRSEIHLGRGAAFVAMDMVRPWHTDTDDYELVAAAAFQAANAVVPWTREAFFRWRVQHGITEPIWEDYEIPPEMFDAARDFVKRCAVEGWAADWSP